MKIFKLFNKNKNMKQLTIDENTAKKHYKSASPEFKSMLEDTFGKDFFSEKITDRIKTIRDACDEVGENYSEFMDSLRGLPKDEIAYKILKVIVRALNGDWIPDWSNSSQYKYFPWFEMSKNPDSGFVYSFCNCWDDTSSVSSHLAFKTKELALYAGKQFDAEYYDYMVI
jgi:hypothetical protein